MQFHTSTNGPDPSALSAETPLQSRPEEDSGSPSSSHSPKAGQPQAWGCVVPPKAKYTLGVTVSRQDQAPKCRTTLGTV